MDLFYTVIESIGVIAFSISGAMVAIRRKTDLFGVILLAIITTLGGGLTRDVIFSFSPPAFFNSKEYLLLSAIVSVIVFLFARKFSNTYLQNETKIEHINDIFDALGLGIFAVMGVKVAFEQGYENNALISITCGMLTCICGGMLRDVLTNSTPFVLVKRIYAIAAIAGASIYYLLYMYVKDVGIEDSFAMIIGLTVTFVLRVLAMAFKWNMPKAIK
ncbi:MAG: trimeric intracellular cation channel family protein [Clostridia bacterium]|nr:trimeric intracellular cation channel family protein [Clostridia bacterium]